MNRYWLSLGSNLDRPIDQLSRAVKALESLGQVVEVSSLYETDPVGPVAQDCFINLCLTLDTELAPHELLASTQKIEQAQLRTRDIHWGPRTIDIDLLMGPSVVDSPNLTMPHPYLYERDFVLIPLAELDTRPSLPVDYPDGPTAQVRRISSTLG